jgi:hypothetical protein
VAFFYKQFGCHLRNELKLKYYHGGKMEEWPNNLQVREFPVEEVIYVESKSEICQISHLYLRREC